MAIRCARTCAAPAPSYSFDVQNSVASQGGRVSGSWAETTHNVLGEVTGTVSGETVRARVQAGQFAADITLIFAGSTLRVTLVPYGTHVREVSIQLRRG